MTSAGKRLADYLAQRPEATPGGIVQLTPDASAREYFRIGWERSDAVACVYPEPFDPAERTYLDVTNLFLKNGLPVARVYDSSSEYGVIIQEDLGDSILRSVLESTNSKRRDGLFDEAIGLIAKIQSATQSAFDSGSIASKLKFDEEKLGFELDFFKTHYFQSLRGRILSGRQAKDLQHEFKELSCELETHASVLCHRDFHAANLMLDKDQRLRIIDHQDARIGPAAYDLVSLLLDRVLQVPGQAWLEGKKRVFHAARKQIGLETIDPEYFDREFDLTAVQRCLKAIGTFSFQTANRGKKGYTEFIEPMFQVVYYACGRLERFPQLRAIIEDEAKL